MNKNNDRSQNIRMMRWHKDLMDFHEGGWKYFEARSYPEWTIGLYERAFESHKLSYEKYKAAVDG